MQARSVTGVELAAVFLELSQLYANVGDIGRSTAFRKSATILNNYQQPIYSGAQVKTTNIGPRTVEYVDEYLRTGKLSKITELQQQLGVEPQSDKKLTLDLFTSYHGIGEATAVKLYEMGLRTLSDIWQLGNLRLATKTYILWREHMQLRIPREEMDHINQQIQIMLANAEGISRHMIAGSYRRLESSSGDIDLLVIADNLPRVLLRLASIVCAVLEGGDYDADLARLIIQLPPDTFCPEGYNAHRLDIHLTTPGSWLYALLYFTGSGPFNEKMRDYARSKGLRLNEKGLFSLATGENVLPNPLDEQAIFAHLGLKYVEPQDRLKTTSTLELM